MARSSLGDSKLSLWMVVKDDHVALHAPILPNPNFTYSFPRGSGSAMCEIDHVICSRRELSSGRRVVWIGFTANSSDASIRSFSVWLTSQGAPCGQTFAAWTSAAAATSQ